MDTTFVWKSALGMEINTYIIFPSVEALDIVLKNSDVLISVSPHLGVHHSEHVHHLVEQSTSGLWPALLLIGKLVVGIKDNL